MPSLIMRLGRLEREAEEVSTSRAAPVMARIKIMAS
jgi:hypothetical protein